MKRPWSLPIKEPSRGDDWQPATERVVAYEREDLATLLIPWHDPTHASGSPTMSGMRSKFKHLFFVLSMGFSTGAAHAAERLLVPFDCIATDEGVIARPSGDQSFPIVSGHEAAPFTACASDDPDLCRTMMLHRFVIDCRGERVSWPEFYAAISRVTTGQARVDEDRLLVRVRPQLQRRRFLERRRRFRQRRSFLVEMPEGFAPISGTVARFAGERTPYASRSADRRDAPPAADRRVARSFEQDNRRPPETATRQPAAQQPRENQKVIPKKAATPTVTTPTIIAPTKTVKPKPTDAQKIKAPAVKTPPISSESKTTKPKPAPPAKLAAPKPVKSAKAPSVTPTIINVPKSKTAVKPAALPNQEPNATQPTRQPQSVRQSPEGKTPQAAQLAPDKETKTAEATGATSAPSINNKSATAVTDKIDWRQPTVAEAPSLASTLAVLAVVATLLLGLTAAAYRFLARSATPKPAPAKKLKDARPKDSRIEPPTINLGIGAKTTQSEKAATREQKPNDQPVQEKEKTPKPTLQVPKDPDPIAASHQLPMSATPREALDFSKMSQSTVTKATVPERATPQLPMPDAIAELVKIKQPDPKVSPLIVPKTRQEALAALGIGDSASTDVIEKVVAGLRQCWKPA
ncbi:MAG: hypothetical protein K0U34_08240, partial [Alphaproteobacteria bacterium]|nr:hypothetical protein [Alphaproteobacteria bacterium]